MQTKQQQNDFFPLKLHKINKIQDKTCFFLRVYYREVKSLRLIENSHNTTLTFLFGAVLTENWGRFPFSIGAVLTGNPVCALAQFVSSSISQSIPNPCEGGRFMFLCSVFFKLANVIYYDPFFLHLYSVISENSLNMLKNGVKHCSYTIVYY